MYRLYGVSNSDRIEQLYGEMGHFQHLQIHFSRAPDRLKLTDLQFYSFRHPSNRFASSKLSCSAFSRPNVEFSACLRCSCGRMQDAPHRNSTPLLLPLLQGVSSQACFFRLQTTQRQPPKHQSYQQHSFPPKHEAVSTFDSRQQQGRMLL